VAERDQRQDVRGDDGLQSGGSRGTSNQGGPEESVHRGEEPAKNSALKVNRGRDEEGSRSTLREPIDPNAAEAGDAAQPGRMTDAPRGPIPPWASRTDYVGGDEPHKTDVGDRTPGASGRRNEVL
jgi:hypothetical protein